MTDQQTIRLNFDVDAALLVELGERLVTRRSVALAELIKNAYDADATVVIISFEDVRSSNGEIVVKDNGLGISFDALRDVWMRIATTDAAVNSKSKKYGRPKTGAKGVGRFACRRLAYRLSLESISNGPHGSERVAANFDWRDFKPSLCQILWKFLPGGLAHQAATASSALTVTAKLKIRQNANLELTHP